MKLLLVCKTPIINKIFELVCNKLNIDLTIQYDAAIEEKVDILIIDYEFIDDSFNYKKQKCLKIGAISQEKLSFDKSCDFIIPRPFLPMQLQDILQDIVEKIKDDNEQKKYKEKKESLIRLEEQNLNPIVNSIAKNIEDNTDVSVISTATINQGGGILDIRDLSEIKSLLEHESKSEVEVDENNMKEISDVIDQAIEEMKNNENGMDGSDIITVILNQFTMDELKPLLLKLDQSSIDKLTNGKSLNLELKLKVNAW